MPTDPDKFEDEDEEDEDKSLDDLFDGLTPEEADAFHAKWAAKLSGEKTLRGEPTSYTWESIDATQKLLVQFVYSKPHGKQWLLTVNKVNAAHFASHADAMVAIANFATGCKEWDDLAGSIDAPQNDDEWTATQ